MDKKEFSTFAMALKTYYPRENLLPNTQAMELWYQELCDLPYNVAVTALREHVQTNKFSPTIAEIREKATTVITGQVQDWGEGWKSVQNAIRKYGMYQPEEALESMDELTAQAVRRLGFKELCTSENTIADRARFKDIYEQLAKRQKEDALLPPSIKKAISEIRKSSMIEKQDVKKIGVSE